MAVPSKQAFDHAITVLQRCDAIELKDLFHPVKFQHGRGQDLVMRAQRSRTEKLQLARRTEVLNWLYDQKAFHEACESAKLTSRGTSDEDMVETHLKRLQEAADAENLELFDRRVASCIGISKLANANWIKLLIIALARYFHTNEAAQMPSIRRKARARVEAAISGWDQITEAFEKFGADRHTRYLLMGRSASWQGVESDLAAMSVWIDRLRKMEELEFEATWPIQRADKTAKERLLVSDLMQLNSLFFKNRKTAAITHLFELEGINTQFDRRMIAKLCTDFHDEFMKLKSLVL